MMTYRETSADDNIIMKNYLVLFSSLQVPTTTLPILAVLRSSIWFFHTDGDVRRLDTNVRRVNKKGMHVS
jgi:hypothetical protein